MIKDIKVCICDICGNMEPMPTIATPYNEEEYKLPKHWATAQTNSNVHFCELCTGLIGANMRVSERGV